jgi:tetratricopeptide (TPR) repeat protein
MRKLYALGIALALVAGCTPGVVSHNEAGNRHFGDTAYEEAIDEYRLAQVAEPDQAEPYYNAANAYNRLGQPEAASAQTQQSLKTAEQGLAARAWYNLGNAHFDAQQWPQAIEAYQEALRIQPDDEDAKHNLELALQQLQQQQQAQAENQQQEEEQSDEEDQGEEGQQRQEPGATPTPENAPEPSEGQDGEEEPTPEPQMSPAGEEGMTPEQAAQLLEALLADSETLQERLQAVRPVPGPDPEQDW